MSIRLVLCVATAAVIAAALIDPPSEPVNLLYYFDLKMTIKILSFSNMGFERNRKNPPQTSYNI